MTKHTARFLGILAVLPTLTSCTNGLPSRGTYDAVMPDKTVMTLHIERIGRHRVVADLQATAVNPKTYKVVNLPVSDLHGRVSGRNLSLQSTGPIYHTTYLGHVEPDAISLSSGNQTTVFRSVTLQEHAADLAEVRTKATALSAFRSDQAVLASIHARIVAQQQELLQYVRWEPEFTAEVTKAQTWYADQIGVYSRCLTSIRAAADARIPEWRWQTCALQVADAAYARQEMLGEIAAVEGKQASMSSAITQAIAAAPATLSAVSVETDKLLANCKYTSDAPACERLFARATQVDKVQRVLYRPQDVLSFQRFQPEAQRNTAALDALRTDQAARLSRLADAVNAVYSRAK